MWFTVRENSNNFFFRSLKYLREYDVYEVAMLRVFSSLTKVKWKGEKEIIFRSQAIRFGILFINYPFKERKLNSNNIKESFLIEFEGGNHNSVNRN